MTTDSEMHNIIDEILELLDAPELLHKHINKNNILTFDRYLNTNDVNELVTTDYIHRKTRLNIETTLTNISTSNISDVISFIKDNLDTSYITDKGYISHDMTDFILKYISDERVGELIAILNEHKNIFDYNNSIIFDNVTHHKDFKTILHNIHNSVKIEQIQLTADISHLNDKNHIAFSNWMYIIKEYSHIISHFTGSGNVLSKIYDNLDKTSTKLKMIMLTKMVKWTSYNIEYIISKLSLFDDPSLMELLSDKLKVYLKTKDISYKEGECLKTNYTSDSEYIKILNNNLSYTKNININLLNEFKSFEDYEK